MSSRLGDLVAELQRRVRLGIGGVALAVQLHLLLGKMIEFPADIAVHRQAVITSVDLGGHDVQPFAGVMPKALSQNRLHIGSFSVQPGNTCSSISSPSRKTATARSMRAKP